jgi:two-component system, LytTR family, sensor kinase
MNVAKPFWIRFGTVLGIWLALAVVLTGQGYLIVYSARQAHSDIGNVQPPLALWELFLSNVVECLIWAFLTLGIFWLAQRFPFGQGHWFRSLLVHVAACLVLGLIQTALSLLAAEIIRHSIIKPTISINVLIYFFVAKLNNNIFFYGAILAVSHVLNYYRQLRERELRSAELEAKLAQTQLQILKMQLHPHFLFNTLNAISALIHQDVDLADRMIARLGDLLRTTLENVNKQEIALEEELEFIGPYLEIEKARLGSRLTVQMQIDPAVLSARVPNMILQPLVENAIRHGIAARIEPGKLEIEAGRDNGYLRLAVKDDGPGLETSVYGAQTTAPPLHSAPSRQVSGIGLANTRARLEKLYGPNQRLDLINNPGGGLQVDITIPYHEIDLEAP